MTVEPTPSPPPIESRLVRRVRRTAWALAAIGTLWIVFAEATLLRPPRDLPPAPAYSLTRDARGTTHYGRSYLRRHGGVWELGLVGDPVGLGDAHARLARDAMFRVEAQMMRLYAHYVPSAALRAFITTLVRAQHRTLDHNYPPPRLREIAAEARALAPDDPYASFLPTYHRLVTLHALYDISLSFEHSPLIGCTALFAAGRHSRDGHTYVGRNFDMEIDPVFDTEKTVVLYRPRGAIPFASVAWPGLTGVVTGMNLAGIFAAIHGARAGSPAPDGVPVPTTVRTILESARDLDTAIAIARRDPPMVSHLLVLVDGDRGRGVVLERAPGRPLAVRPLGSAGGVSNHYTDRNLAADPHDASVRENTSTLARQARVNELLAENDGRFDPAVMLGVLRDRRGPGGAALPLGHRGTLDAWIATHSVVADATERVLWVSASPHTLGRYERFDLRRLLADEYVSDDDVSSAVLPADPALDDGRFARWTQAHELVRAGEGRLSKDPSGALALADRALAQIAPERDQDALLLRARALTALDHSDGARAAWRAVLEAAPASPAEAAEARAGAR